MRDVKIELGGRRKERKFQFKDLGITDLAQIEKEVLINK